MRAAGVESRYALYRELGVLGETVFINAAPFLRVRRTGNDSMTNTDILVRLRRLETLSQLCVGRACLRMRRYLYPKP